MSYNYVDHNFDDCLHRYIIQGVYNSAEDRLVYQASVDDLEDCEEFVESSAQEVVDDILNYFNDLGHEVKWLWVPFYTMNSSGELFVFVQKG